MTETSRMADTLYEKAIGLISVNDVDGAIRLAELKFFSSTCDLQVFGKIPNKIRWIEI